MVTGLLISKYRVNRWKKSLLQNVAAKSQVNLGGIADNRFYSFFQRLLFHDYQTLLIIKFLGFIVLFYFGGGGRGRGEYLSN